VSQLTGFLGNHVKRRRKELKFSQEALAEKTGLSTPSLSEIERGIANPTLLTLEKIAAALDTSVAGLLDMEGRPNVPPEQLKQRVLEQLGKMKEDQVKLVAGLLDIPLT
jgi:transcriptional regulator with XRE-family HTH domain